MLHAFCKGSRNHIWWYSYILDMEFYFWLQVYSFSTFFLSNGGDTPRNVTCFLECISWLLNDDGLSTDLQKWPSLSLCVCLKSVEKSVLVCCPQKHYTAYLVYKFAPGANGFDNQPVDVTMRLNEGEFGARTVSWNPQGGCWHNGSVTVRGSVHYPKGRGDGWLETELGDFFNAEGEDGELEMKLFDDTSHWKHGLILEGIEIRPKHGRWMSNYFMYQSAKLVLVSSIHHYQ